MQTARNTIKRIKRTLLFDEGKAVFIDMLKYYLTFMEGVFPVSIF